MTRVVVGNVQIFHIAFQIRTLYFSRKPVSLCHWDRLLGVQELPVGQDAQQLPCSSRWLAWSLPSIWGFEPWPYQDSLCRLQADCTLNTQTSPWSQSQSPLLTFRNFLVCSTDDTFDMVICSFTLFYPPTGTTQVRHVCSNTRGWLLFQDELSTGSAIQEFSELSAAWCC